MRSQIFITFDSLRWDVFDNAKLPFLKGLGAWKRAYTPGLYTLPAHMSFFAGKLPQTFDEQNYYDTVAVRFDENGRRPGQRRFWNLNNPELPRDAKHAFEGRNIVEGFKKKGYRTIGTGAVNWFNPKYPASAPLIESFEKFRFFSEGSFSKHAYAEEQLEWALKEVNQSEEPFFLFINFGETHVNYVYKNCDWYDEVSPRGDAEKCKFRQGKCVEYLDKIVEKLCNSVGEVDLIICSDHGEAMGEDDLWGHGFAHPKVSEIPFLIREWE